MKIDISDISVSAFRLNRISIRQRFMQKIRTTLFEKFKIVISEYMWKLGKCFIHYQLRKLSSSDIYQVSNRNELPRSYAKYSLPFDVTLKSYSRLHSRAISTKPKIMTRMFEESFFKSSGRDVISLDRAKYLILSPFKKSLP